VCLVLWFGSMAGAQTETRSVTFFVVADPQVNIPRWGTAGTEQTLQCMNELPGQPFPFGDHVDEPQGVLVLGDLVDDIRNPANWEKYTTLFDPNGRSLLRFPAYECIGNHDLDGQAGPPGFSSVQKEVIQRNLRHPGPIYRDRDNYHYSWDWDRLHFVCLHLFPGVQPRPVYGRTAPWNDPRNSLDFLRRDLAERVGDSGRPVVLLWHYGLTGWGLEEWWTDEDLAHLQEVLRPYSIVLILHGHEHAYRRYTWAGYDVCMAPSPQYDRDPDNPLSVSRPKGFLVIRLQADQLQVACHMDGKWQQTWAKAVITKQATAAPVPITR
jgi:hypothetical protein